MNDTINNFNQKELSGRDARLWKEWKELDTLCAKRKASSPNPRQPSLSYIVRRKNVMGLPAEYEICAIFNKFYGQHPDTKTDFIIHIDPIKKKYELSLYRYGLKQPVIIPESAYQLIVFKSGFENYCSDNYNQPTGAWIW